MVNAKFKQQPSTAKSQESYSLIIGAAGLILGFLIAFLVFQGRETPIYGSLSIGLVSGLIAIVAGAVAFLFAYLPTLPKYHKTWFSQSMRFIDVFAMTFAHCGIVFLAIFGLSNIIQQAFTGLLLDHIASASIVGLVVAVVTYMLYASGANINTGTIPMLLLILMLAGGFTSMLTADNENWWQDNFSALGTGISWSASTFNVTMIIGGIILTSMSNYLATDLSAMAPRHRLGKRWKINVVRFLLAGMGLCLVLLGVVDVATSLLVHNIGAYGLGLGFMILIALLPLLLPGLAVPFYFISLSMLLALIGSLLLLNPVGYINTTAFELIAAGIVFTWFTLFVRQLEAIREDEEDEAAEAVYENVPPQDSTP